MIELPVDDVRRMFGMGVAGNFAGHLEQAGEAADFASVAADQADVPKGVFPWYVPGDGGFLGVFPVTGDVLTLPTGEEDARLQIEPEVGVVCSVSYDMDGAVSGLMPIAAGAFNDCSIRRPHAAKISEKKNWGGASKGLASRLFSVGDLDVDGALRTLRIASFLRRDGEVFEYGVDSPAAGYTFAGRRLLDWLVDRLVGQREVPGTPLEDVGALVRAAGCPDQMVIGIGATRYTQFGERNFLMAGDESVVVVYDETSVDHAGVVAAVSADRESELADASVLCQRVQLSS